MKKYFKWPLLLLIGGLVFGCAKDELTGESEGLGFSKSLSECNRSLSFTKEVTSYVAFDAPESELTLGEKLLRIPKSDLRVYSFCETPSGTVNTSIVQNPDLESNSDYGANILGAPRKISWRAETIGNTKTLYDQDGTVISSSTLDAALSNFDNVIKAYQSPLVGEAIYRNFVGAMRENMRVEDLDENITVVTSGIDTGTSKSYFDKRSQKEVAMEVYDSADNLISRSSNFYMVEGNVSYLTTTIKTTFKESPDSDRIMSLITVSNYKY